MNSIPHEGEWGSVKQKRRSNATKIVQMLHGMHTKSSKRFNISIAVMQGVNVFVHGFDVNEAMSKIKVEFSI